MPHDKIINESALGLFLMSWTDGPDNRRHILAWDPGMPAPDFTCAINGRQVPFGPIPAGLLDKLGWKPPKTAAQFRAFALAYAAYLHQAWETSEDGE